MDKKNTAIKISSDKFPVIYNDFTSMALNLTGNYANVDNSLDGAKYVCNKNMNPNQGRSRTSN